MASSTNFSAIQQKPCPLQELYPRKRRAPFAMGPSELPFEIMIELLTWLPVKSLIRFKCVSQQWLSLIQDYNFIAEHLDRSTTPLELSYQYKCEDNKTAKVKVLDENYIYISSCSGLLLERRFGNSQVFRIRNPATHQVIYLPDAHGSTSSMSFVFNSITGECKVGFAHYFQHQAHIEGRGFKVMTIGKDEQWRFLKVPNQNDKVVLKPYTSGLDNVEGAAHMVDIITDGQDSYLEVQSLDLWTECFTISTMPQGVFADLSKVHLMVWNHRVAVAEIAVEALNVLVLEDFKQRKWSKEKITVPLKFLKDWPKLKDRLRPGRADSFQSGVEYIAIAFYDLKVTDGWKYMLSCDMKGKIVQVAKPIKTDGSYYSLALEKPSLIALEGMKPEIAYNQE